MHRRCLAILFSAAGLAACDPAGDLVTEPGVRIVGVEAQQPPRRRQPDTPTLRRTEPLRPRHPPIEVPSPAMTMPQRSVVPAPAPVPREPFQGTVPRREGTGRPRNDIVYDSMRR